MLKGSVSMKKISIPLPVAAGECLPESVNARLVSVDLPVVMGILNVTDDSFYSASRLGSEEALVARALQMKEEGAGILDVGACSTRPGSEPVDEQTELRRLVPSLRALREVLPDMPLSVDTFRACVVEQCVRECGTFVVNDISGCPDAEMAAVVARYRLPYVLTHNGGMCAEAQRREGEDIVACAKRFFAQKVQELREKGVETIILDPGFGFCKTLEDNYRLLAHLDELCPKGEPLLVGVSRKSMIQRVLEVDAAHALNGTTALHAVALRKGADILRVHDVRAACETVALMLQLGRAENDAENE